MTDIKKKIILNSEEQVLRKVLFGLVVLFIWLPLPFSIVKILSEKGVIKQPIILKVDRILSGAYPVPEDPVLSVKNILNGKFQNDFEKYFSFEMFARPTMTRAYNQLIYSFFNSPNTDRVLIGKDKQLYEPW